MEILDPTTTVAQDIIDFAARPKSLRGLRIGLIENTKKNAEALLRGMAARMVAEHGMTLAGLVHKPQRSPLTDAQLSELQGEVDFIISGVGDCGACSSGTVLDAITLERRGIPAIAIITEPFEPTAKEMAELWGVPDFRFVMIRHPLANLTEAGLPERVDEAARKSLALLLEGQPTQRTEETKMRLRA
jgi:hypothetical protein